jgi:hypothetical protein
MVTNKAVFKFASFRVVFESILTSFQGAFRQAQLKMHLQIAPNFLSWNLSSQKPLV